MFIISAWKIKHHYFRYAIPENCTDQHELSVENWADDYLQMSLHNFSKRDYWYDLREVFYLLRSPYSVFCNCLNLIFFFTEKKIPKTSKLYKYSVIDHIIAHKLLTLKLPFSIQNLSIFYRRLSFHTFYASVSKPRLNSRYNIWFFFASKI